MEIVIFLKIALLFFSTCRRTNLGSDNLTPKRISISNNLLNGQLQTTPQTHHAAYFFDLGARHLVEVEAVTDEGVVGGAVGALGVRRERVDRERAGVACNYNQANSIKKETGVYILS